ncbi:MAG: NAD(P)/FAD-dependent oxidoreductase [Thermoplasmata archaeon]|nr:NAD(P)/FAD-dependent oxidoreductase [Thermoplasmata archaeon]
MEDYDVVVVGGGPAGCRLAEGTAERGHRTVVLEEHPEIGVPVQCAGLVSPRTVRKLMPPASVVLAEMRGADVIGPSVGFSFKSTEVRAFVIDRAAFDAFAAERARRAGAEIRLEARVDGVKGGEVMVGGERLCGSVVVGADGPSSIVRASMGLDGPRYIFPSVQQDMSDWTGARDRVAIIADQDVAPGFFAWAIPTGSGARVGTAVAPGTIPAIESLERAIARFQGSGHLGSGDGLGLVGGAIPIGPLRRVSVGGTLLVGDAAGQVKPLSGGGLFPGLSGAEIAVEAIDGALKEEAPLREYDRIWKRDHLGELTFGLRVRESYMGLGNDDIDRIFGIMAREEVGEAIALNGDIDHPSMLSGPLVKAAPDIVGEVAKTILGDALGSLMRRLGLKGEN